MDIGNLILFWFVGGFVLMIINFIFFRFAFIRKLILTIAAIWLVAAGSELSKAMETYSLYKSGAFPPGQNAGIAGMVETLTTSSIIMLMFVILMSFGDSLLDFEDSTEYRGEVWEGLLATYIRVSEETVTTSAFFGYYMISTVVAFLIYLICFVWLGWINIFWIIGWIVLGFTYVLKPLIIKFSN